MAYQPRWIPQLLNEQQVGIPDYAKAMMQGYQTGFAPALMGADLLGKALKAKYDAFKSTPEYEQAMLNFLSGRGALASLQAQNYLSPYDKLKAEADIKAKAAEQSSNLKEAKDIEQELPDFEKNMANIERMQQINKAHPYYFGPASTIPLLSRITGPDYRATTKLANEPEYGEYAQLLGPLVAARSREISNRGLASALKFASATKAGYEMPAQAAAGNLQSTWQEMKRAADQARARYKYLTGKDIGKSTYSKYMQPEDSEEAKAQARIQKEVDSVPKGKMRLYKNGKPYLIPAELANDFLKQKGASASE